jgi:hypothetical protein
MDCRCLNKKKAALTLLVFLVLLGSTLGSTVRPVNAQGSEVDTSTSSSPTFYPIQRKAFHASGRFWAFYTDGSHILFKSSTDGSSWSSATVVRDDCNTGADFAVFYDGTYVHYAFSSQDSGDPLFYRRGTPETDGTITWSAAEQTVVDPPGTQSIIFPTIAVDSDGYPFILYNEGALALKVVKSLTNDGTWTTENSWTVKSGYSIGQLVALTDSKMYVLYCESNSLMYGKLWTGSSWGSEESVSTSNVYSNVMWSATAINDDVHVAFLQKSTYIIMHVYRTYNTGSWSTEIEVYDADTSQSAPVIASSGNSLVCFWGESPNPDKYYYKMADSEGNWDASPTLFVDETADTLWGNRINGFYKAYDGYVGLLYTAGSTSPYKVKFKELFVGGLEPTDDAYVASGEPDSTHDSSDSLYVGQHSSLNKTYTFLQFDVSGLSGDLTFTLSLYCSNDYALPFVVHLYSVKNDSWDESTLTWNNKPANVSLLDTRASVNTGTWINFTSPELDYFLSSQMAGDDVVSLMLGYETYSSGDTYSTFRPREYTSVSHRPKPYHKK